MKNPYLAKPVSFVLAAAMILAMFAFGEIPGYAAEDVTDLLKNQTVTVRQEGKVIPPDGSVDAAGPMSVRMEFEVPASGSSGGGIHPYVKKGDRAEIVIVSGAGMIVSSAPTMTFETDDGKKIGTVTLESDPSAGKVTAKILFDAEDGVFEDPTVHNILCGFMAELEYGGPGASFPSGDNAVEILGKTFIFHVPDPERTVTGTKTGTVSGSSVLWKVQISAAGGSSASPLDGLVFSDDLSAAGAYVEGSFRAGAPDDPAAEYGGADPVLPVYDRGEQKLTYTFPAGSGTDRVLFFLTSIPDEQYYSGSGDLTFTNTAEVRDENGRIALMTGAAVFNGKWIEKKAENRDHKNGYVTWSILVNPSGLTLENAVIEEKMSRNQIWDSAVVQIRNGGIWTTHPGISFSSEPAEGRYLLGTIHTPVRLNIKAKVTGEIALNYQVVTNAAFFTWKEAPEAVSSGVISTTVGFSPIRKNAGIYSPAARSVPWTVTVKKSPDTSGSLRTAEMLIYGDKALPVSAFSTVSGGSGLTGFTLETLKQVSRTRYNQKYKEGSFRFVSGGSQDLEHAVYHLKDKSGEVVADLLIVAGAGGAGIDVSREDRTYSFETTVLDPDLYAGNRTLKNAVSNSVTLLRGDVRVNSTSARADVGGRMLMKDMLPAAAGDFSDPAHANQAPAPADRGFNYKDKTAVFRIHINANNLDDVANSPTTRDGVSLGAVTLKEMLPAGWSFRDFEPGVPFYLFEGTGSASGAVTADARVSDASLVISRAAFAANGAEFRFADLRKAYVLLLKAGPDESAAASYLNNNGSVTVNNTASLVYENGITPVTDTQEITIKGNILQKNLSSADVSRLTWSLDYKPYGLNFAGTVITDTLPVGLELPSDENGEPVLAGNIRAYTLDLRPDGSASTGGAVDLTYGQDVIYNNATRELSFRLPDPAVSYRFFYKTDTTANVGTILTNTVRLSGGATDSAPSSKSYKVKDVDVWAIMNRSGHVEIIKKGEGGEALSGAGFTLFSRDGSTPVRTGVTAADGSLFLRGLAEGTYVLKETKAPEGYLLSGEKYEVVVKKTGSSFSASIAGGTDRITLTNRKTGGESPGPEAKPDPSAPRPEVRTQSDPPPHQPDQPDSRHPAPRPDQPDQLKPEAPADQPDTDTPSYTISEVPDPNVPGSPATFTLMDENNRMIDIYEKRKKDDGTFEYISTEGVPLGFAPVPRTGREAEETMLAMMMLLSLLGAGSLWLLRRRFCKRVNVM